jgi:hypothetical protein
MEEKQTGSPIGTGANGIEKVFIRAAHSVAPHQGVYLASESRSGFLHRGNFSTDRLVTFENPYSHKLFHSDRSCRNRHFVQIGDFCGFDRPGLRVGAVCFCRRWPGYSFLGVVSS